MPVKAAVPGEGLLSHPRRKQFSERPSLLSGATEPLGARLPEPVQVLVGLEEQRVVGAGGEQVTKPPVTALLLQPLTAVGEQVRLDLPGRLSRFARRHVGSTIAARAPRIALGEPI